MRHMLSAAAALLLIPSLGWSAGFALFEHGNRAMAMGGAFTAVADDPSAMFWNPAGLAFQSNEGVQLMGGATLIFPKQDFTGTNPYPGQGYTSSQIEQTFYPLHMYVSVPLNERSVFGFSVMTPFGLGTWWDDDNRGRFISKRADLKAFDLSPHLAFKVTDHLAFGIGVDYRISSIDLTRNIPGVDPFTQQVEDIAQVHLFTEGTNNDGWGWHASFLGELGAGFSFGVLYRSEVTVDYEGNASFSQFGTGNPQYDALVASQLPFDRNPPVVTKIEFPDYLSVGLAWRSERFTVSAQWGRMGWSSFQELAVTFTEDPQFSFALEQNYEDTNQYRLGAEYKISQNWAIQGGLLFDETPQPIEIMSPLLADGDRTGYSAGVSWSLKRFWLDFGYLFLPLDGRSTEGMSESGYDGAYEGDASLAGVTLGFKF